MNHTILIGILIPFLGTSLGSACVFFMKQQMKRSVERALIGFASGVMVAASIWSLLVPAMEQASSMGKWSFLPAETGFWAGVLFLLVLDRTIPLVKMKMVRQADGTVRHEALADFSRIHTLVICGCGFPHWEGNFDGLKQMCRTCFGNPDMVCVPETPMLNVPAAAVVADPLLARFQQAGEEYASTLSLSAETIAKLETPMISAEEYIRNVNGT